MSHSRSRDALISTLGPAYQPIIFWWRYFRVEISQSVPLADRWRSHYTRKHLPSSPAASVRRSAINGRRLCDGREAKSSATDCFAHRVAGRKSTVDVITRRTILQHRPPPWTPTSLWPCMAAWHDRPITGEFRGSLRLPPFPLNVKKLTRVHPAYISELTAPPHTSKFQVSQLIRSFCSY